MKNSLKYVVILIAAFSLFSCGSSVNVVNRWKSDNAKDLAQKNILVIAKAATEKGRMAFEDEIAKGLRSEGFKASESYKKYPNFKHESDNKEEQQARIKELLKKDGFNGVILTHIKDKLTNIETTKEGGYNAGASLSSVTYYPTFIPVNYYGFYGYYGTSFINTMPYRNAIAYRADGAYMEETIETRTTNSYVLESVGYDLDLPEDKQLVVIVTTKIDEPDSVHTAARMYAKKILENYEKN